MFTRLLNNKPDNEKARSRRAKDAQMIVHEDI